MESKYFKFISSPLGVRVLDNKSETRDYSFKDFNR